MFRRPPANRLRQRGFSLLEAVVSIVLISTTGLALFSWINSNLISLGRVQETNARAEATQNALEYMAAVNPMLVPTGKTSLGDMTLGWEAKLISPIKDGTAYPAGMGLWQFALYDTNIKVAQEGDRPGFSFHLKQIGYKRVRSLEF
ncbi:MAG: prepilin-type N-terminal cleavage/methylation domain-containing protein [Lentisphaerota bacterium]